MARFLTHHPRRWTQQANVPDEEKKFVWDVVIQLLQQYDMMQSSPQLQRFAWNMPYFIQWHAVIHILDTLRAEPLLNDAAKAWKLIETLYRNNEEMLLGTNQPILVAVGNLCLKAFSARETVLAKEGKRMEEVPAYITKLREHRNEVRTRREADLARRTKRKTPSCDTTNDATPTHSNIQSQSPADGLHGVQPQQYSTPSHFPIPSGDDPLWLSDALDNPNFGFEVADMMDLDTQGYGLREERVDWAQWDAWLGGVEPLRTNPGAGH
jgi:hypothetical protein